VNQPVFIFMLEKSFDINHDALGGSAPAAMQFVAKFPEQVILRHRNAPPPPIGAGLVQGGGISLLKKKVVSRAFFLGLGRDPGF
jgi:hypothetical protein